MEEDKTWSLAEINNEFFVDAKVWENLNQLVLEMQRYVLRHPDYQAINPQTNFQKAAKGDQKEEEFCMVNIRVCSIEINAFYMLKTMDGVFDYTHENLLAFDDFSVYVPLF